MELILLEKVAKLGDPGDLVRVKSGYGRNFLIPSGKAVRADEENKAEYEKRKDDLLKAEAERLAAAEEVAKKLDSLEINIKVAVSEEETLYGSIGTREIAESLETKGIIIEKSSIRLPEGTLKELGEFIVDIELHPEVIRGIKVIVSAQEET
ncbi:MAG: 50S ribosomal protein L9 [Acidimicrobiaceae bacterium]|jgi:large subunit ribosomal protein L9|nr:50S ribosomal protein L9 [Acidimicrobiaceae bacterium]HJL95874.1 50S ribosomal protein L9 [SAR86 cluster bacterium]|tara:strand:+ start:303 stop:758 length:456 start_codon:yes stop_codon:yes gene_type:complete